VKIRGILEKPSWWIGLIPVSLIIAVLSIYGPHWVALAGTLTFLSMMIFGLAKKLR
jgi:hypothetical protein